MDETFYKSELTGPELDAALRRVANALVETDTTLSQSGAAADAEATGKAIEAAKEGINESLEKKAPAGYGLGESTGQYVSDCDLALANGWYQTDADTLNTPDTVGPHGGTLLVSNYGTDQTVQTFFEIGYSAVQHILIRRQAWGEWKPWEWVNPPMTVGVEYRTIERYMGKVVYTKLIDCGAAANAAAVSLGIDSIDRVCEFFAEADNIISPFGSTASAYYLHIMCDGPRVIIYCGESVVGKQVYVRIKYTKFA